MMVTLGLIAFIGIAIIVLRSSPALGGLLLVLIAGAAAYVFFRL